MIEANIHRSVGSDIGALAATQLQEAGYCVLRGLMPADLMARINGELDTDFRETPFCEGAFYGERTKRFGRLLRRSPTVSSLVLHPVLRAVTDAILGSWCDAVQLNVAQAIEIHPGALAQFPHRDQDMWPGACGDPEYLINVIWPLTPFTRDNGATRIWPGSHGIRGDVASSEAEPVVGEAEPGDAIVFLGSTLHAAGANVTGLTRRGIVIGYSLGWLRAYENQTLAYPPDVARSFPPELAALVGYRQHRPNLGNFEGQCPSVMLNGADGERRLAATDALRPDQAEHLARFVEAQHAAQHSGRRPPAPAAG